MVHPIQKNCSTQPISVESWTNVTKNRAEYSNKITEWGGSWKELFRKTKNLIGRKGEIILPCYLSDNHFFTKKTSTIRETIINNGSKMSDTILMSADVTFEGEHLTHLKHATQDQVRCFIMNSPSMSCDLDPQPNNLLKKVLKCLLPQITTIIKK